jgi:hypothetical protein
MYANGTLSDSLRVAKKLDIQSRFSQIVEMRTGHEKYTAILLAAVTTFGIAAPLKATLVTAYLHEIHLSGTFATTIDPNISNLPDSTYPFPQIRGGSFDGTFVYDSMASLDAPLSRGGRFPFVSVDINILDNQGAIANTITSSPNNFSVGNSFAGLNFGPSFGRINSIDDLRLDLSGSFTLALPPVPPELPHGWRHLNVGGIAPPPPSEITAGVLSLGFLETDGPLAFTYWDLPVSNVVLTQTRTTPYLREVPDAGSTILLLGVGVVSLFPVSRALRPREIARN